MSFQLQFLPEIPDDIAAAIAWYTERQAKAAQAFLNQLHAVLARIAETPEIHAAGFRGVRSARLQRFPYVLRDCVVESTVLVMAITHAKRHARTWQSRL